MLSVDRVVGGLYIPTGREIFTDPLICYSVTLWPEGARKKESVAVNVTKTSVKEQNGKESCFGSWACLVVGVDGN